MAAKSAYDALAAPFTTWVLGPKFVRNSSCSRAGQAACRIVVGPRCPPKASELPSTPTKVGRPNCVACSGHPLPTRFVMVEMIGSVELEGPVLCEWRFQLFGCCRIVDCCRFVCKFNRP